MHGPPHQHPGGLRRIDDIFDDNRDDNLRQLGHALDATRTRRPGEEHRRVNVDFPVWMIAALDREATRRGVTRQSLIKVWIAEKLDRGKHPAA